MTTFGDELKALREWSRISQSRLGEAAGFDHSYISRLESGARVPTREAVLFLAEALDASAEERDRLLASAGFILPADPTGIVLLDVTSERRRQTERWGVQLLSWPEWILVLTEEVGEAAQAANASHFHGISTAHLREELVQVAAVAVQIMEAIDSMEHKRREAA